MINYDKVYKMFGWVDDGVGFKGTFGVYTADLSWDYPNKQATLLVRRHNVVVHGAQGPEISAMYNVVYKQKEAERNRRTKEYTLAFEDIFAVEE